MSKFLCLTGCFLFFVAGCSTRSTPPQSNAGKVPTETLHTRPNSPFKQSGRATIVDKKNGKPVSFTWVAISNGRDRLKMDFFGAFNTLLGRYVSTPSEQVLLHAEKKRAYKGPQALEKIIPLRLTTTDLLATLTGRPPQAWNCDPQSALANCTLPEGLVYRLLSASDRQLEWSLEGPLFRLEVLTTSFQTMVEFGDEVFAIKIPEGYTLR